jgi:uncharacterized protein YdhG (YjbR/CyaY superfamily)
MTSKATTINQYLEELPEDRKDIITKIYKGIKKNLPKGFEDCMSYGMIGFVVPKTTYPNGYHCDPKLPLPFINIASQKNHIAIYHMGLYSDTNLTKWFEEEWLNHGFKKADLGKSCLRFKKAADVPLKLIEELVSKMSPEKWIEIYESVLKSRTKK